MTRTLVWAADARRDLREIFEFVSARNVAAAYRLEVLILDCAARIQTIPLAYRPGRVDGTREAVAHPNYVLIYRVFDDRVRILRVVHSRRSYP